ncbi:MAG: hypothetical protein ACXWL2_00845 [Candidatus Chromulinivorax sp.]
MKKILLFCLLHFFMPSLWSCCIKDFLEKPLVKNLNHNLNPFSLGCQSADHAERAVKNDFFSICDSQDCKKATAKIGQAVVVGFCIDKCLGYHDNQSAKIAFQLALTGYAYRTTEFTYKKWFNKNNHEYLILENKKQQ